MGNKDHVKGVRSMGGASWAKSCSPKDCVPQLSVFRQYWLPERHTLRALMTGVLFKHKKTSLLQTLGFSLEVMSCRSSSHKVLSPKKRSCTENWASKLRNFRVSEGACKTST